jgi:NTP pyrophosphatase (non-canonical NTP hydrolase)
MKMDKALAEIIGALTKFRDERNWLQFHNAKDLALALSIEAAELNELFLWKSAEEADPEKLKDELADIFSFAFLLADKYKFNVKQIVLEKIEKNALRYPLSKAKNNAKKYTDL